MADALGSRRRAIGPRPPPALGWAADENLFIHAYHMPFPGLGRVERHGSAFRWSPVA